MLHPRASIAYELLHCKYQTSGSPIRLPLLAFHIIFPTDNVFSPSNEKRGRGRGRLGPDLSTSKETSSRRRDRSQCARIRKISRRYSDDEGVPSAGKFKGRGTFSPARPTATHTRGRHRFGNVCAARSRLLFLSFSKKKIIFFRILLLILWSGLWILDTVSY